MIRAVPLPSRLTGFLREEAGAVMALWIMSLVAVIAFVALVFDIGRVQVTHGELQSFADSVALAAAGELDGRDGAIARATAAAAEVADSVVYGNDLTLQGAGDYTLSFLTDLPPSDSTSASGYALSAPYDEDDDAVAAFVRVQVNRTGFLNLGFLAATRALLGSGNTASADFAVEAIAGFTLEACDIAPMMVCLPSGWTANANAGQMIELRAGGDGAAWTPGEFGFLQQNLLNTGGPCAAYSGTKQDLCYLAAAGAVTRCFAQDGVDFKTGQSTGNYAAAINTRFDIYQSTMGGSEADPLYAPAPNRISGIEVSRKVNGASGNISCDYDPSPDTIGLPPDTCFDEETCGGYDGRFGNGIWDRKKYFAVNYLGMELYVLDKKGKPTDTENDFSDVSWEEIEAALPAAMSAWLDSNALTVQTATRFEIYRAENAISGDILTGAETGRPECNLTSNPLVDEYRRTLVAAGIACTNAEGESLYSGSEQDVPVEEFVMLFLTKPAVNDASGDKFTIWAEVVQSVGGNGLGGAGTGGKFRDVVQLYR